MPAAAETAPDEDVAPVTLGSTRRVLELREVAAREQDDGCFSRSGRTHSGEPDRIAAELAADAAVRAADTILLTVPSQLGVEYNAAMLETIAREVAPAIGWAPRDITTLTA